MSEVGVDADRLLVECTDEGLIRVHISATNSINKCSHCHPLPVQIPDVQTENSRVLRARFHLIAQLVDEFRYNLARILRVNLNSSFIWKINNFRTFHKSSQQLHQDWRKVISKSKFFLFSSNLNQESSESESKSSVFETETNTFIQS